MTDEWLRIEDLLNESNGEKNIRYDEGIDRWKDRR